MSKQHALLSPSGASRWLKCTPSARLEEKILVDEPHLFSGKNFYADEGTLAHDLVEAQLMIVLDMQQETPEVDQWLDQIKTSEYYNEDMQDYCNDFVQYVMDKFAEVKTFCPDAKIYPETIIDLSTIIPESFGRSDVIIVADEILFVFDFKYGKGVAVSAVDNAQVMLYGYGAYLKFEMLYDIKHIEMCIYQPRLDAITTFTQTVEQLHDYIEKIVVPIAKIAFTGAGDLVTGDHCKFCKYSVRCIAMQEKSLVAAQMEFRLPEDLSDTEIIKVLKDASIIKNWLLHVEEYALINAVKNGYQWPGYKLVAGRTKRVYSDQDKVIEKLAEKFTTDQFLKPKSLLSFKALEKNIGKKLFDKIVVPYLIKPQGKPTLVPDSDNRPAINSLAQAQLEFKDLPIDE